MTAQPREAGARVAFGDVNVGRSGNLGRPTAGAGTGDPAEDGTIHQAGTAGIVEVKNAADQLTGGKQTRDPRTISVDHACVGVDLEPAEGECNAARHRIRFKWRLVDG